MITRASSHTIKPQRTVTIILWTAVKKTKQGENLMLKRVKIQGYKSLEDVEVHLQPLSVCFGPNASGKSNLLDALQLLSRIATSNNLNDAFRPPYRGTPLESFTFGADGIQGHLAKESVSFTIEVDVEVSQKAIDTVSKLTVTDKTHGQTPISVGVLSEGTLRILGLLALASVKEAPSLIGIEEPENGIHPHRLDLIALLLQERASDDTQVIATTHSPTLVDLIPQKSLYTFDKVNGKTAIESLSSWKARRQKRSSKSKFEDMPISKRILRGDDFN